MDNQAKFNLKNNIAIDVIYTDSWPTFGENAYGFKCGDGVCSTADSENATNCPIDCKLLTGCT